MPSPPERGRTQLAGSPRPRAEPGTAAPALAPAAPGGKRPRTHRGSRPGRERSRAEGKLQTNFIREDLPPSHEVQKGTRLSFRTPPRGVWAWLAPIAAPDFADGSRVKDCSAIIGSLYNFVPQNKGWQPKYIYIKIKDLLRKRLE